MKLELHFSPGSCSRVTMIALEETGQPYEARLVAFMAGEHRQPEYLSLNPAGKVPVLVVDGEAITQNAAILTFLARRFPKSALLPDATSPLDEVRAIAELSAFTADLHPIVTRIAFPQLLVDLPECAHGLRAKATEAMQFQLQRYEKRLNVQDWVFGSRWTILDAYLSWVWFRITGAGFDPLPFPCIARHFERVANRPSVERALAREAEAIRTLEARGLMPRPRT